jgi:hypothetical protein
MFHQARLSAGLFRLGGSPMKPLCRDCRVELEPGFQIDHGHSSIEQARWVPGEPVPKRFFFPSEASRGQHAEAMRVTSYRCPKCGLLDSYAIDPQ